MLETRLKGKKHLKHPKTSFFLGRGNEVVAKIVIKKVLLVEKHHGL